MIGIVIVAHGELAQEYKRAIEHVVGIQDNILAVNIRANDHRCKKEAEICDAANKVDKGNGVLVVTDLFGGSPCNLSLKACSVANRKILYGANLPMLIKLVRSRHHDVEKAARMALDAARKYIDCHNPE